MPEDDHLIKIAFLKILLQVWNRDEPSVIVRFPIPLSRIEFRHPHMARVNVFQNP